VINDKSSKQGKILQIHQNLHHVTLSVQILSSILGKSPSSVSTKLTSTYHVILEVNKSENFSSDYLQLLWSFDHNFTIRNMAHGWLYRINRNQLKLG